MRGADHERKGGFRLLKYALPPAGEAMASNIEIKARARDFATQCERAQALATDGPLALHQVDTFFPCASGRLKLREFADGSAELIQYVRADTAELRESRYEKVAVPEPAVLKRALHNALGEDIVVSKQRTVWFSGRTRIHLDRVEGLGEFIELEVVLAEGDGYEDAQREAEALLEALGVAPEDHLQDAYADMLRRGVV